MIFIHYATIESFHKMLKKGYVWPREFADIQEAKEVLLAAFEDYNHRRIHSALKYMEPPSSPCSIGRTRRASCLI